MFLYRFCFINNLYLCELIIKYRIFFKIELLLEFLFYNICIGFFVIFEKKDN